MDRRDVLKAAAATPLAWLGSAGVSAHAQNKPYPSRSLTLVVPFAAGNPADVLARVVTEKLSASIGQPVVVENRPGAGGVGAIRHVAAAAPDGYTLLLIGAASPISQALFKPQPYDLLKQFVPVSGLSATQVLILVNKQSRLNSLADFVQEAKVKKDRLMVGVSLLGTTQHLSAELFKFNAGLDYTIVPFKTAAEVAMALSAGDVHVAFDLIPAALAQLRSGQMKALAIGASKRSELVPEVPTVDELGVKNFHVMSWGMVVAPAQTPAPIVQLLNKGIQRGMNEPDVVKRFKDLGLDPLGGSPTQARDLLVDEITRWSTVIEQAKISLR